MLARELLRQARRPARETLRLAESRAAVKLRLELHLLVLATLPLEREKEERLLL